MRSFALAEIVVAGCVLAGCTTDAQVGSIDRCALGVRADDVTALEGEVAHPFDVLRYYHGWDDAPFPTAEEQATGHTILISFNGKRMGANPLPFARVADPDDPEVSADLAAMAERVRAYGQPIYLVFHDEANGDTSFGTPAEYVAAYRRVVAAFRAAGATNVRWVLSLSSSAYPSVADAWYPGDDVVDYLGVTGFNWFNGADTPWRTFAGVFASFFEWSHAHAKPLVIVSTASGENPNVEPGEAKSKATWFREARATIAGEPRLQLVVWFSVGSDDMVYKDWRVDSTQSSLGAFRELAHDPHFDVTP
ncbi:MAG: hypothetical protein ABI678_10780 [Kofleriaceae bacterium]